MFKIIARLFRSKKEPVNYGDQRSILIASSIKHTTFTPDRKKVQNGG